MTVLESVLKFGDVAVDKTLERDVAKMAKVREILLERAQAVTTEAHNIAPVAGGSYRDGIVATTVTDTEGAAVGRVNANDYKSGWIEFGTSTQPAQHILTRACEAALGQTATAHKHAEGV